MRTALVIRTLVGGGAERSVINLAAGLVGRGHAVDIVLLQPLVDYPAPDGARVLVVDIRRGRARVRPWPDPGPNAAAMPTAGATLPSEPAAWLRTLAAVRWDPLSLPGRRALRQGLALAAYIAQERPDCVLANLWSATRAAFVARGLVAGPPPVAPVFRGLFRTRRPRMWRRLLRPAARLVAVSHGVADSVAAELGVPRARITTIYNPVVTADLPARMAECVDHPWLSDRVTPVILAAGRLVQQKDFPTLIRAFALVARKHRCRLVILGEGEDRKPLERLAAELDLAHRISLPGWVENPFAFMARAALFVLSSRHEGLPGVLVQALACGCPSVSTDCPAGPAEILRNGEFGPLVPVGDPTALADAMERALDAPPDRQALQRRAAHFSVERATTAYAALLAELAGSAVPADGGPGGFRSAADGRTVVRHRHQTGRGTKQTPPHARAAGAEQAAEDRRHRRRPGHEAARDEAGGEAAQAQAGADGRTAAGGETAPPGPSGTDPGDP